jgi:putative transposase
MHQSERWVRLVAEPDGLEADRGQKEQRGLLQSMATRAAFLADPTPGMVFHSTPKHASWRHQMALWCSMVVRKVLTRARCTSVEDLHTKVLACLEYFHATMAKPCKWTYGRQPLSV